MTMTIQSFVQFVGKQALAEELNVRLRDKRYRTFRFAVAFARWSGLHLLDPALRSFAERPGNKIACLVGVDLGGTTIEALTYLSELPHSRVRVVRSGMPQVVFHAKVYAFEGPTHWTLILGSPNLSTGGLWSNIESYVLIEGTPSDRSVLNSLFAPFDNPPFTGHHVQLVDAALLQELAPVLARYTSTPPDREAGSRGGDPPPLDPEFRSPRPDGRPPERTTAKRRRRSEQVEPVSVPIHESRLYMELWDETGGGTQVQIAKRVFTEFFGASPGVTTYVTLDTPGGAIPAVRLQWFSNATFRIGLPFVGHSDSGAGRRGVLRFTRTAPDHYTVELRTMGDRQYDTWLRRCDDETGFGRKHWGVH